MFKDILSFLFPSFFMSSKNAEKKKEPEKKSSGGSSGSDSDEDFSDSYFSTMQALSASYLLNSNSDKRIVIFGHTHAAKIISSENHNGKKSIYANSGTWIDNNNVGPTTMNFVVITPQNSNASSQTIIKLYNYKNEVMTKMAEDSLRY